MAERPASNATYVLSVNSVSPTPADTAAVAVPNDDDDTDDAGKAEQSEVSSCWQGFGVGVLTCCFPTTCIRRGLGKRSDAEVRAWREKVALNCCIYLTSAAVLFVFAVLPLLVCPAPDIYTVEDINAQGSRRAWIIVHGRVYDMDPGRGRIRIPGLTPSTAASAEEPFFDRHPGGSRVLVDFLGRDASDFFRRPAWAPGVNTTCSGGVGPCHAPEDLATAETAGVLAHGGTADLTGSWVVLFDVVLNTTEYLRRTSDDDAAARLDPPALHALLVNRNREDATAVYRALFPNNETLAELQRAFFAGVLDRRADLVCDGLNVVVLVFTVVILVVVVVKLLLAICGGAILTGGSGGEGEDADAAYARASLVSSSSADAKFPAVLVLVPCYTEDVASLRKTFDSVAGQQYPRGRRTMLVVCDGMVRGEGQGRPTPEHVLSLLDRTPCAVGSVHAYEAVATGDRRTNVARVYTGTYGSGSLPVVVVVKIGTPAEAVLGKPGNRGKRDSQVLVMRTLSAAFHGDASVADGLEAALVQALEQASGHGIETFRYLFSVDADTRIDPRAMYEMTMHMKARPATIAVCGETRVDNPTDSWVSAIQVYEYYISHHFSKAFESRLGIVTCLPGCFSMYKLWHGRSSETRRPLLVHRDVVRRYAHADLVTLHDRNLYELGEDRYLTTLLLDAFVRSGTGRRRKRIEFLPTAVCWTTVPNRFRVLQSQRRRWINSTVHNLFELFQLRTLPGVCLVSMQFLVFLDILSTFSMPASIVYLAYLVAQFIVLGSPISQLVIVSLIVMYAVQLFLFAVRRQWSYLWWMTVYVTGIPLWYFWLPLYAFWHFDDFNWGQTRKLAKHDPLARPGNSA